MESAATLAISSLVLGAILLLAFLAVVVWLQTQQSRQNRESQTFLTSLLTSTLSSLSESQSLQLQSLRQASEQTTLTLSSQLSSAQTQFLQHQQVQTQEVMVALSTSVGRAVDSISSTTRQLSDLVASSQAMIATKDSIAYQQVRGASLPFTGDDGAGPYTSVEELAQNDADRAEAARLAEQGLAAIMNMAGVQSVDPYPAAGAAFAEAAPPAQ